MLCKHRTSSLLLTCSLSTASPSSAGVQLGESSNVRRYASSAFSVLPNLRQQAAMPSRTSGGQLGQVRSACL